MNNNPLGHRPPIRADSAPALKPQAHLPTLRQDADSLHRMLTEYQHVRATGSSKAKHALATVVGARMGAFANRLLMTNNPAERAAGWNALRDLHSFADAQGKNIHKAIAPARAMLEDADINLVADMRKEAHSGVDAHRHGELRVQAQSIALNSPSGAARRMAENFLHSQASIPQSAPQAQVNQPQIGAFARPQQHQGAGLRQQAPAMRPRENPPPPDSQTVQMPDPRQFLGAQRAPNGVPPPPANPPAQRAQLAAHGVNMRQRTSSQPHQMQQRNDVPAMLRPGYQAPAQAMQQRSDVPAALRPGYQASAQAVQRRPVVASQQATGPQPLPQMMRATKSKAEQVFSPEQLKAMGLPHKMKVRELNVDGARYYMTETRRKGGFGKVRYAIDDKGNKWALKEFRTEKSPFKENSKTRITSEADVMKEIERLAEASPSMRIGHVMNVDGKIYVSMTAMHDEVTAIHNHGVKITHRKEVARDITRQMARDLAHTNAMGYVHRDVKLDNALFDPSGRIILSDFGLAWHPQKDGPANVAGTPIFMAPEQWSGRYDAKVDTWSLGRAFMDAHIGHRSPFDMAGIGQADEAHRSFRAWRQGLVVNDGSGRIDLSRIASPNVPLERKTGWDHTFHQIAKTDPEACAYLLEHMLNPNPVARHSTAQVHAFFESKRPPEGSEGRRAQDSVLQQHWGREMIKDTTTDELVGGLHRYAQAKQQYGIP